MKVLFGTDCQIQSGDPSIFGATLMGGMMNYAVAVPGVDAVALHVYRETDRELLYSILMESTDRFGDVFSVKVQGTGKDQCYLYEANGVTFPDPFAKRLIGREHYGKKLSARAHRTLLSASRMQPFSWQGDQSPHISFADMILYKLHVRGFTMETGSSHKGTFLGITDKAEYLKNLGINAVLLMPCTEFNELVETGVSEAVPAFSSSRFYSSNTAKDKDYLKPIQEQGARVNYWGYCDHYFYFAPKASYAYRPEKADAEFKGMVRKLHQNGIEVLVELYLPENVNRTMVLAALRFLVKEYHVDGFRLNLNHIDAEMLATDPYLAGVKLIGEGFPVDQIYDKDVTPKPVHLAEYHDGFLTDARRFLKSDEGMAGAFAERVIRSGSKQGVINYITDHNGFTLADLYMYDVKHNEPNGEHGRDGTDYNFSWNCGAEGPDRRKKIRDLRLKMKKNALLTLFLSQGTPMLLAGDEFGNSQNGNNNAYCQDNMTGWVDWKGQRANAELTAFVQKLTALRKEHPVLHQGKELKRTDYLSCGCPDVSVHSTRAWFPNGSPYNRSIGILLCGDFAEKEAHKVDDSFYIAFNMHWEEQSFDIPALPGGTQWELLLATDPSASYRSGEVRMSIPPRTIAVLIGRAQSKEAKAKK